MDNSRERLTKIVSDCRLCGKHSVLTDEDLCPECHWPRAFISYDEASSSFGQSILEKEGYIPVSGWSKYRYGGVYLLGYIHEQRTRDGWKEAFRAAEDENLQVSTLKPMEPENLYQPSEESARWMESGGQLPPAKQAACE